MGFMVYQMDVKSDFLYGMINEEVYVCQALGFEGLTILTRQWVSQRIDRSDLIYQKEKKRYFACTDVKSANTLVDTEKTLVKDVDGADVDVHLYRSMTGSLMYITTSRPDIILISCHCKKQTLDVTSTIEAEYAAAASCYR
uniref:Reverse transcriptase Ty1/copia-type domain-containing protein n=1 Tax=Tanacetum cinerariifolium TaxID=118510 RepID=A0A699Q6J2_TANCI|nr:hypothetical protein [Tanacetum cinerariifolium]